MAAGTEYTAGTTGGNNSITLASSQIPSLNITGSTAAYTGTTTSTGSHTHTFSGTTASAGSHTHTTATEGGQYATVSGGTVDGIVSSIGSGSVSFYVRALSNLTTGSAGEHTHTFSGTTASAGVHNHSFTVPSRTVTAAYTNNSLVSVNVTNKYLAVYMWKRVA